MDRRSFLRKGGLIGGALSLPQYAPFIMDDEIPIVDTHLHLWDLDRLDYPWLKNPNNILSRNFLLKDYHIATQGCPIEKMVFVECGRDPNQYLEEVDWVIGVREKENRIAGMVAYFPLEKGEGGMKEMEILAERDIVRGIRKAFMPEHSGFNAGIQILKKMGYSYDLNIRPAELPAAYSFAKANPDLVIILDHIANPDIGNMDWKVWSKAILPFSSLANVSCKISGMLTKTNQSGNRLDQMRPYFNTVLDVFGIDRVIFGGDWPVLLRAASYQDWIRDFYALSKLLTSSEKKKLYHQNARSVYRV
ncbi:amidohydrolase family protein [Cyclobacterium sp. 1_MG-2023]|uniref:amidohydrolase family protein n=1 Tax=Cyclobacterium sp. 1_MG-2023 TaxID=3062681 RepID=UPI0026E3FD83|nr:amidohydrolase family protein [Cyclobacterium sp. 1_MG-2023]MDO6437540.1 amidohydrolase family protein [Cyclobacterium sp. 1_MG-2023]